MSRRTHFRVSAILFLIVGNLVAPAAAAKPHIVFVLLDDVGYNDVGWHNEQMHTPFLNKLAREGVILESYYTNFVCTPSRASLLTGYYSDKLGMQRNVLVATEPYGIPVSFKLISDRLRNAGYSTHAIGKWHVGFCNWKYTPTYRGFDSFFGFYNGAEENYKHCTSYLFNNSNGDCVGFDFRENIRLAHQYDGKYSSEIYTERAKNLINTWKPKDKPLFMYISYVDTHFPIQPPQRYVNKCGQNVNEARHQFCGAMAAVDEAVENITMALKSNRMYQNTVIVLASDNGGATDFGASNFPLRGEKTTIFEGGTRVPAFVHSPLLRRKGYINKRIMHVTDWYPTLLHIAGAEKVQGLDGVNQWNAINPPKGPSGNLLPFVTPRRYLPYHMDIYDNGSIVAAIRDSRFKLIVGSGGIADRIITERESEDHSYDVPYFQRYVKRNRPWFNFSDTTYKLFDLQEDPSESVNLASERPQKLKELIFQLNKFKAQSKPYSNLALDPKGDPANYNNNFEPGWCKPFYNTPSKP